MGDRSCRRPGADRLPALCRPGRARAGLRSRCADGSLAWEARALDATNGDGFGAALAIVGSDVLVGAPLDDRDGLDTGSVHLLDTATGRVRHRYANPSGRSGENFGHAVAGDRHIVLVGAPYAPVNESGAGVAYVLDARSGALREALAPEPNEADANAGRAVAVTASRFLVGGSDWSGSGWSECSIAERWCAPV